MRRGWLVKLVAADWRLAQLEHLVTIVQHAVFDALSLRHLRRGCILAAGHHLLARVCTHITLLHGSRSAHHVFTAQAARISIRDLWQEGLDTLEGPQLLGASKTQLVLHLDILRSERSAMKYKIRLLI